MIKFFKSIASSILALTLALSLTVSAFAAWPSFQNDNTNNGVVTTAPPTTTPTVVNTVGLSTNNPYGSVYTGVDSASVISNGYVYTVYNGGVYNAATGLGGARVAKTELATGSVTSALLSANASNISQLATPYIDGSTLWALDAYTTTTWSASSYAGWSTDGGATISGDTATFPASSTSSVTSTGFALPQTVDSVSTLSVQTNLNSGSSTTSTYGITLAGNGETYQLVPVGTAFSGSYGTYYTYNDTPIPTKDGSGNPIDYQITITVTAGTTAATASSVTLGGYYWEFQSVNASTLAVSLIATGEGQPNTPISYGSDGTNSYVYFGIWGGTRSYYQYNTGGTGTLTAFKPGTAGDNFYWAGAAFITDGKNYFAVFGSDSGAVYLQQAGANFGGTGTKFTISTDGQIRSSIVAASGNLYFTSKEGAGQDGRLWAITQSDAFVGADTSLAYEVVKASSSSTSTPVVSVSDYIYVGSNDAFSSGTVQVFTYNPTTPVIANLDAVYTGDPVQSSPIVWTDEEADPTVDYIYFTTNSGTGKGYCYSFNGTAPAAVWQAGGSSSNPYAVQGFASDDEYLVYGDDGNVLYIMH
jgi:hypothetical protein